MKRINKLTEGGNLLWESSRMILPEHKERIRIRREEARRGGRRERPVPGYESLWWARERELEKRRKD